MSTASQKLIDSSNAGHDSLDESVLEFSIGPLVDGDRASTETEEHCTAGQNASSASDTEERSKLSSSFAVGTPKPHKRVRDDSDNDFSDSDCDVLPPPHKHRKTLRTPPKKQVRFHPDVNVLVILSKYASEGRSTLDPREGGSCVASLQSVLLAESPVCADAGSSSSILHSSEPPLLAHTPIPGSPSLTQAALADAGYTSDTEDAPDTEQTWSICAEHGDKSIRHDCDDVSIPRASPPPSARGISTPPDSRPDEKNHGDCDQPPGANADGNEMTRSQSDLPPIFMRPQSDLTMQNKAGSWIGTPFSSKTLDMFFSAFTALALPLRLTSEEITQQTHVLSAILSRLPADEARASREAVEKLTCWQGQQGYEAGYHDGMREKAESVAKGMILNHIVSDNHP